MPITTSAKKALRGSQKKHGFNMRSKKAIDTTMKKFKKLVAEKNVKDATVILPALFQVLDKASKTGYIKPNNASRNKSRAVALLKTIEGKK